MCGIVAFVHSCDSEAARVVVATSLTSIGHRGQPEFQGEIGGMEGLTGGTNRLAFTSGARPQPEADLRNVLQLFLNGEIYTLHGLAAEAGASRSDTGLLADDIADLGLEAALGRHRGIYALVVFDSRDACAYVARDRFGVKPLYFARLETGLLFASELKAFTPHRVVGDIEHVPPGSILRVDRLGTMTTVKPGTDFHASMVRPSSASFSKTLAEELLRAVGEQTCDGHDYAVLLSGGLDSSAIYAAAKTLGRSVRPFVVGTAKALDVKHAIMMADHYGDEISVVDCPAEDELYETLGEVVATVESFEPNVVRQSAVSLVLARAIHRAGFRVALCGEGADELFGGYPEFWAGEREFGKTRANLLADLHRTQLQRVDRTAMACTLEVRVPFLDDRIADLALSRDELLDFAMDPKGINAKLPLRLAMQHLLPPEVAWRPKAVLSEGAGLRGNNPTRGMFSDLLVLETGDDLAPEALARWRLSSHEERQYFSLFRSAGYERYAGAARRVFANSVNTVHA